MNAELAMNLETVLVALIVSVIAPGVLALITNRQRRLEKAEDYKRQDEVAQRVVKVAERQLASTEQVIEATASTAAKLEQIHVLVNSSVTALMQAEIDGVARELVLLGTMKSMNVAAKRKVDPGVETLMKVASERMVGLKAAIVERAKQTQIADAAVGA